jgi:hypothetical protein
LRSEAVGDPANTELATRQKYTVSTKINALFIYSSMDSYCNWCHEIFEINITRC